MGAFESFMIFLLLSQCNLFSNMPARFLFIVFSTKLWSFVKYIIFVWLSFAFFPVESLRLPLNTFKEDIFEYFKVQHELYYIVLPLYKLGPLYNF